MERRDHDKKRASSKTPSSTLKRAKPTVYPAKKKKTRQQPFSDDQFRLMVEAVKDYAIYMLDPKGRIMSWNPGAQRIKGYAANEVLGKHYSMFFTKEAIDAGKPQLELALAKRDGRFEEEGWRVRKLGPQFWANVVLTPIYHNGRLRGYVKVTRDLTERKAAQDALLQSEQWLRTTLESIGDGVIATDAAGDVKFLNPVAEALSGWKQADAKGQPLDTVFSIVNEETRQPVTSPFFKVVASGNIVG